MKPFMIVGLGELLWDRLPDGNKLGGAPANFAYHATVLGDQGIVATRVGTDELGDQALKLLESAGLNISHVQKDDLHPTGAVDVTVDEKGQASYVFLSDVAWDHFELTDDWKTVASQADAVCFGSLAQRCAASRATVQAFMAALPAQTLRVFDVNLRGAFYDADVIKSSLRYSDILKLNEDELPIVAKLLDIPWTTDKETLEAIRKAHDLKLVCYTRSSRGCYFASATETADHPGYKVSVKDTIGAGDAFTATVVHHYLAGSSLDVIAEQSSRRGAWVASQTGAMPDPATYDDSSFSKASHV